MVGPPFHPFRGGRGQLLSLSVRFLECMIPWVGSGVRTIPAIVSVRTVGHYRHSWLELVADSGAPLF